MLGWLLAAVAVAGCVKLAMKNFERKRVRTVGVQTTTTFKRHYVTPRMMELKDGECGIWIDLAEGVRAELAKAWATGVV